MNDELKGPKLWGKVRIQDIVAKSAGVNLEHTVKVLTTLVMVADALGEHALSNSLYLLLKDSARVDGVPAKLKSVPGIRDGNYCEDFYDVMYEVFGADAIRNLKTMWTDPYYEASRNDLEVDGET